MWTVVLMMRIATRHVVCRPKLVECKFSISVSNKDRKKGVYSVASKHPAAAKSCSIYCNVKPSLKDRAYCKAGMPDYQNVEKQIAAILIL